jgi:hypothetical protein
VCWQVPQRQRDAARVNQRILMPGTNFMMLNGMLVEVKNFELYSECGCACVLHQTGGW